MPTVIVYPDQQAVADATGARLGTLLIDTVATKGRADVVLTGGTVGIGLLASLAASPLARLVDWTSVHVWWGDERFVEQGHPERNELQAHVALLSHVPLPEENIHRVGAARDGLSAEDAAAEYASLIAEHGSPEWDVVLLGLGPDGHVASVFPGQPQGLATGAAVVAILDSPKPPPARVSLTVGEINRAARVWVVAAGEAKADVVAKCLRGDGALPGALVHGAAQTLWLIDAAASTAI